MSRLPVLCTMDVCVELRRSGGSGPDCRNPEVVVAITGRVLHNAPGCSKSCGEEGGVGGPCEPRRAAQERAWNNTGINTEDPPQTPGPGLTLTKWLYSSVRRVFIPVNMQHLLFGIGASSTLSSACKQFINGLLNRLSTLIPPPKISPGMSSRDCTPWMFD